MRTKNKEIYIALIVGLIMFLLCFCLYTINKQNKQVSIEYKVYKLYEKEDNKEEHYYKECPISTDDKINIHADFKKITHLSDKSALTGVGITGNYKIVSPEEEYIAFDDVSGEKVYVGSKNKIFAYSSSIYEDLIKRCGE